MVDESKLRRGHATANELWGNKTSVLVGDFPAPAVRFQLMVADGSLASLRILSDASAVISQGEVMQLMAANMPETTKAHYLEIISAKTAELFAAACQIGPVIAEKPEWEKSRCAASGKKLGIAFQLVDDALDYSASEQELGKEVGDDFREGKITLPVITAYQAGNDAEKLFWKRTLEAQKQTEGDLQTAMEYILKHQGIEKTLKLARAFCAECRLLLTPFPESEEKQALLETVDFCVQRAY